jgi:DNA-binding transcriptional ArsR family regulator
MKTTEYTDHDVAAARLLTTVSNAKRLAILRHLAEREYAVGELAVCVDLSQSALSQHLSKLRRGDLVTTRRHGQNIYYSTASASVKRLLKTLDFIFSNT